MELLVAYCVLLLRSSDAFSAQEVQPLFLWPLNKNTIGYDVVNRKDSIHPERQQGFPYNLTGNEELIEPSTLIFDGNSYIDVVIDEIEPISNPVFNMFLKGDTTNQSKMTVLHYKATSPDSQDIVSLSLEFIRGILNMTLTYGNSSKISVRCSYGYRISHMLLLSIYHNFKSGVLEIFYNADHLHVPITGLADKKLDVPGILRLGGSQDESTMFIGELSCVSLMNVAVTKNSTSIISPDVIKEICNKNPNPVYLWPLDSEAQFTEFINDVTSERFNVYPSRYQDGPVLLNSSQALRFDGSFLSSAEAMINKDIFEGTFHVMTYIYLDVISDGVVLIIRDSSDDDAVLMKIEEGYFEIEIFSSNSDTRCGYLRSFSLLQTLNWIPVDLSVEGENMNLNIDGVFSSSKHTCSLDNNGQLKLIIGTDNPVDEGFKGALRCLLVFESPLTHSDLERTLVNSCNTEQVNLFRRPQSVVIFSIRSSKYQLRKRDAAPPPSVPPLKALTNKTLASCGKLCLSFTYCRTYAYSSDDMCSLYDMYMLKKLRETIGTNYYVVIHLD